MTRGVAFGRDRLDQRLVARGVGLHACRIGLAQAHLAPRLLEVTLQLRNATPQRSVLQRVPGCRLQFLPRPSSGKLAVFGVVHTVQNM